MGFGDGCCNFAVCDRLDAMADENRDSRAIDDIRECMRRTSHTKTRACDKNAPEMFRERDKWN